MKSQWISSRQAPDSGARVEFICTGSQETQRGTFDGIRFINSETGATVDTKVVDKWRALDGSGPEGVD